MGKLKKGICCLLSALMMVSVCLMTRPQDIRADISESVWQNYNGEIVFYDEPSECFIYQTMDVKKTSSVFYRTIGIEFSRIKKDVDPTDGLHGGSHFYVGESDGHVYVDAGTLPVNQKWSYDGKQREYIIVPLSQYDSTKKEYDTKDAKGNNVRITTYMIQKDDLLRSIGNVYPDWRDEIEEKLANNERAYIGIDCIITMYRHGEKGGAEGDIQLASGQFRGEIYDWSNWNKLITAAPWAKEETKTISIPSHFNRFLVMGANTKTEKETEGVEDLTGMTDGSCVLVKNMDSEASNVEAGNDTNQSGDNYAAPDLRTYNDDDTFDIGVKIPTTEDYTNAINLDSWYGHVNVSSRSVVKTYKVPYDITVTKQVPVTHTGSQITSSDMSGQVSGGKTYGDWYIRIEDASSPSGYQYVMSYTYETTSTQTYHYSGSISYEMDPVQYYYISGMNLLEYNNALVTNDFSSVPYSSRADIQYDIAINGEKHSSADHSAFAGTAYTPDDDYHIIWPDITGYSVDGTFDSSELDPSDSSVQHYVKQQFATYIGAKEIIVKNDELTLDGSNYISQNGINFTFVKNAKVEMNENPANDKVTGSTVVTIPEETNNGYYYTTLQATYNRFAAGSSAEMRTMTFKDNELSIPAIMAGYEQNEPIVVHSPVVAPISMMGEGKTQLINQTGATQLILDNTYNVDFDWNTYFQQKGYTNVSGFTKYVKNKQVRFPFSAKVNDTYYDVESATGYTEWIDLGNVESFEFYLPSWAAEGVYGVADYTGYDVNTNPVQVRVFANNSSAVNNMEEYTYNSDLGNYVATYNYPVQVSGVIYDFKVTGINDEQIFGGYDRSEGIGVYQFTKHKQEKRVGTTNRFGETNVRYVLDGTLTNAWDLINTIPFTNGKSNIYSGGTFGGMGFLQAGHEFGFTFKTISRLYNNDDTIKITPTYRYIAPDGTVTEDVNIYYDLDGKSFIKAGSPQDSNKIQTVSIGDAYFAYSYYDYGDYDPVSYTAKKFDKSNNEILYHETPSYTVGSITLQSTQKLLTGDEEELEANKDNSSADGLRYRKTNGLGDINRTVYDKFEKSMQTWYGEYKIPSKIHVVKKNPAGSQYEDDFQKTLAEKGQASEDDDYWLDDGYLILGFKIDTYVHGTNEHLTYYGGANGTGLDMWERERKNDPDTTKVRDVYELDDVEIRDGDVAIITLDTKLSDQYTTGVLYLN